MPEKIVIAIVLLPLVAMALIALQILAGHNNTDKHEKVAARISALSGLLVLLLLLVWDTIALLSAPPGHIDLGRWFGSGDYFVNLSFLLDRTSLLLATVMALISLLTVRFSTNYMHREAGYYRFLMILNLFAGAMSLIVISGNAILTFVGWELAGLSSYLLIGYALDRPAATINANRAFIANRIGDAGFLLSVFLCFAWLGGIEWHQLSATPAAPGTIGLGLIVLGFLLAAMTKSAQVPFSPWIARALEGPTPSSAIFYGSLMVHAGIILLIRLEPLLHRVPIAMALIVLVGLLTVVYGWMGSLVQSDVKSSLMFATTAQTGLMFVWCGLGWFELATAHVALHAIWRAYQFLHAPTLMHLLNRPARPVPSWIGKRRWLHNAVMQRFWLEHLGNAVLARPALKLGEDARSFEEHFVNPLIGLPQQARAVSSLAQWEEWKARPEQTLPSTTGSGLGLAGRLMEVLASAMHWFEEHLVLKGGGEGLLVTLHRLGNYLIKVDRLLSQPRYLLVMIFITFVVVL